VGRMYVVNLDATGVTTARDVFEIKATTTKGFILHEVRITQATEAGDAQAEQFKFTVKRAAGTYTSGSGGSTPSPEQLNSADAAEAITVEANNTTQASAGTGTLTTLFSVAESVFNGWHYLPTPECRLTFNAASNPEACVISMTAPADTLDLLAYAVIEEIP
jgi:hypothetical protein